MSYKSVCEEIVEYVCSKGSATPAEVYGRTRHKYVAKARVLIWCALRSLNFSITYVALMFGRDHATIGKLTAEASEEVKEEAKNILLEIGYEPQKWNEKTKKGETRYSRPTFVKILEKLEKPKRTKIVKVPDYKNYCILEKVIEY